MPGLRFVTNLRPQSIASFEGASFQPDAWLLSTHRLEPQTQRYAEDVRAAGIDLYADNGTKPLIDAVAALHKHDAAPISAEWAALRSADPDAAPPAALRRRAVQLADAVCDEVDTHLKARPVTDVIDDQLRMDPTHVFAQEDFAIAVLTVLGLERDLLGWGAAQYSARNERTLRRWRRTAEDPRMRGRCVFAVLSAVDYTTAVSAGRVAARYGADSLAYGFAGPNSDTSWTDRVYLGRTPVPLPSKAPNRYARIPLILGGFVDGMAAGKQTLRHFHALGCGATPQFPALVAAMPAWTDVSTDATSPLKDAVTDRVAYHYDPAEWADRITVLEGANAVITGDDWSCGCMFCAYIKDRFGWHPDRAIRAAAALDRDLDVTDLDPAAPIGTALPVFATARGSAAGPMTRSRAGHNHWVIELLCSLVPERQRRTWAEDTLQQLATIRSGSIRAGIQAMAVITEALTEHHNN